MIEQTRYLLFLDECGTHDMRRIDPDFPVFVLMGLLVGEAYYQRTLVPRVKNMKRTHLPDPDAVLVSSRIRKCVGDFAFLLHSPEEKQAFYGATNRLFSGLRIRLAAVVVNKHRLQQRSLIPLNPYHVSLSQLLSVLCGPPFRHPRRAVRVSSVIAESRGRVEDRQLQAEYQLLRQQGLFSYGAMDVRDRRAATVQRSFPDRVIFARKRQALAGLELVDLAAYPIARAVISGDFTSSAMQVIDKKLRALIVFP